MTARWGTLTDLTPESPDGSPSYNEKCLVPLNHPYMKRKVSIAPYLSTIFSFPMSMARAVMQAIGLDPLPNVPFEMMACTV